MGYPPPPVPRDYVSMPQPTTAAVLQLPERRLPLKGKGLTSLAEKAYHEIKQMILENRVHGGEYLFEDDLAKAVGMSRTPLREALVQLQNEGLVAIVPRRGIQVVPLTVADIREVHDLLQWLESQAAYALAARADRGEPVKALGKLVDQMKRALTAGDIDGWAKANDQFHVTLIASAGNGRLERICEILLDQSQRVRAFTLRLRKPPTRTTESHARMLKAIAAGDGEEAVAIQIANKRAWLAEFEGIVDRLQLRSL
jgi:DNA-binding GntR family transcriptional regulator